MTTFKFPTGITVRSKLTGFTGVIVARMELLNGAIHYGIAPKSTENDDIRAYVDEADLVKLGGGRLPKPEKVNFRLKLGQRVKSSITGLKGTITHRRIDHNKCVLYGVAYKPLFRDPKEIWVFEQELVPRKSWFSKDVALNNPKKPTGCASNVGGLLNG